MSGTETLERQAFLDEYANCTYELCGAEDTPLGYRPNLALNTILVALFGISMIVHLIQGLKWRTWGFMIGMVVGSFVEVLGYAGRVWFHYDLYNPSTAPFLMQICCLTIAPAFIAAGIYLCLSRIVTIFGADISRIPPKGYTYIFITCDFISLSLQGSGGGIASTSSDDGQEPVLGTNLMLAGLGFQVFTLALFMALCAEYAFRVSRSIHANPTSLDPLHSTLRESKRFKAFLITLALTTTLIMIRSIYRVIELSEGWNGPLLRNEPLFFVLEGVMVVLAVLLFNVFHPGWCFSDGYGKNAKIGGAVGAKGMEGSDVSMSMRSRDVESR